MIHGSCLNLDAGNFQPLTIFPKSFVLDLGQGSEYGSGYGGIFAKSSEDPRLTDEISGVETAFIEQQEHFKISKITR